MNIQKVIEQLGYSPKESKVYLAALALGEFHVSDMAAKLKIPRSSVQVIVDKLHKDGLMNFYVQRRYKFWVAENPERLLDQLREREASVSAVLPELAALRTASDDKPSVKVYAGVDEIRLIYDDILATRQPILGIIPWDDWVRLLGREFMEDFIEKRVKHFLPIRLISPQTELTAGLKGRDAKELRSIRYAAKDKRINTTTLIYGTKVAIISLNKKLPTAVVIDDADIRETGEMFFEGLWQESIE